MRDRTSQLSTIIFGNYKRWTVKGLGRSLYIAYIIDIASRQIGALEVVVSHPH
jgi:hypothetical protein